MINVKGVFVGQCGNNIMEIALANGFDGIAVNTNEIDTEVIQGVTDNIVILGKSKEGAGKNPKVSKKIYDESRELFVNEAKEKLADAEVIIIVGALGGGTACGQMERIHRDLKSLFPKTIILQWSVSPALIEDPKAQSNALGATKEMIETASASYRDIDNDSYHADGSVQEQYNFINSELVDDMCLIRGDYNKTSKYRNLDVKDMKVLLKNKGLMRINKIKAIKEADLNNKYSNSIDAIILESIRNSIDVKMQKDKNIKNLGIIMNLTQTMYDILDLDFAKLQKEIGLATTIFPHIDIVESEKDTSIYTIMTGLSNPETRLSEMAAKVQALKEQKASIKQVESVFENTDWALDDEDEDDE